VDEYQIMADDGEVLAVVWYRDIAETVAWGICYHKHFCVTLCLQGRPIKVYIPGVKTTQWVDIRYPGEAHHEDKEKKDASVTVRREISRRSETSVARPGHSA